MSKMSSVVLSFHTHTRTYLPPDSDSPYKDRIPSHLIRIAYRLLSRSLVSDIVRFRDAESSIPDLI